MRYLPHSSRDREEMLKTIGISKQSDLFAHIPSELRVQKPYNLPDHQSELDVESFFKNLSEQNDTSRTSPLLLGAGVYHHHIPAAVDHLIQRGEFLTSYTPYQPEVSQGTLQYLFEFQTMVARLTGMDIANASMYDGSTACSEAILMAHRIKDRNTALISGGLHPHYVEVAENQSHFLNKKIRKLSPNPHGTEDLLGEITSDLSCVIVQYPDFFGNIPDLKRISEACHSQDVLMVVVVTEIVALGLLEAPGAQGADIVVCEGQSLGVGLNYGGPHVGLMACKHEYLRQLPGRLVGQSVDSFGKRAWTLTLVAREQHIRRERATSNICTNAGLCALAFTIHLSLLGESGFLKLAKLNHVKALNLASKLEKIPKVSVLSGSFFNEFTIELPCAAKHVIENISPLAGLPLAPLYGAEFDNMLLIAVTELVTDAQINQFVIQLEHVLKVDRDESYICSRA